MADSMRIRPPDPSDRVAGLASSIIHVYHGEHDADAALALLADPFSWIGGDEGDGGIGVESFLSAWLREGRTLDALRYRRRALRCHRACARHISRHRKLRASHRFRSKRDRVHRSTRIHGVPARRRKLPMPPDPSLRPFDAGAHECRQPRAGTKYRRARYAHRGESSPMPAIRFRPSAISSSETDRRAS